MVTEHFSLTPKEDFHSDLSQIVCALDGYRAERRPVTLLSYYRELPITSNSTLLLFDKGKYEINVSEMHLQVIFSQMQVLLMVDGCDVLADCSSVNTRKSTAVIFGFRYIKLYASQREAFRLNIEAELMVDFSNGERKISGKLVDISLTGCRIKIMSGDLLTGSAVVLEIHLFDEEKSREICRCIAARIVHVYCNDTINYCCLEFIGTHSDQDLLSHYLVQKQIALLRDFRQHKMLT